MKIYANMHTHSSHSDGGYTPNELAYAAKKEGYGAIVLTDHDNITGFPEMRSACEALGLETVLGVEFSSPSKLLPAKPGVKTENNSFHICGYGFDPEHPGICQYLTELSAQKTAQTKELFDLAVQKGLLRGITWEEVIALNSEKTYINGKQIFAAMQAKGLVTQKDHQWFVTEVNRPLLPLVFPCEFRQEYEIIQLIREAGGLAILAHPHEQLQYMEALMEMGICGLEVSHHLLTPEEQTAAIQLAIEKNLYISGGSDHKGQCSGYYERYETPQLARCYAPPLSLGTSKEYFNEIKNKRICR